MRSVPVALSAWGFRPELLQWWWYCTGSAQGLIQAATVLGQPAREPYGGDKEWLCEQPGHWGLLSSPDYNGSPVGIG